MSLSAGLVARLLAVGCAALAAAAASAGLAPPGAVAAPRGPDCPQIQVDRHSVRGPGGGVRRDDGRPGPGMDWRPGEFILQFRESVPAATQRCVVSHLPVRVIDPRYLGAGGYWLRADPGVGVLALADALRAAGLVRWVSPNMVDVGPEPLPAEGPQMPVQPTGRLSAAQRGELAVTRRWPNDPLFPEQWYLFSGQVAGDDGTPRYTGIGAAQAWSDQIGSPKYRVGVIENTLDSRKRGNDFWQTGWFSGSDNVYDHYAKAVNSAIDSPRYEWKKGYPPSEVSKATIDHGTAVASVIGAFGNNRMAGVGVLWRTKLVVATGADTEWANLLAAMNFLGSQDVKIVNMSLQFGAGEHRAGKDSVVADMLKSASAVMGKYPDTLWVVAASNEAFNNDYASDGTGGPKALWPKFAETLYGRYRLDFWTNPATYPPTLDSKDGKQKEYADNVPCALRTIQRVKGGNRVPFGELGPFRDGRRGNLICVAASNQEGQLAYFSNYGRHTVEFAAPGQRILVPMRGADFGTYTYDQGTSFAAPLVTGVAGLVRGKYPQLSAVEVKCILMRAAQRAPLPDQNIDIPRSPAFLQPPDKPLVFDKVIRLPEVDFELSPDRLPADQLLRVMGIPNAVFALDEANRLVLDKSVKKLSPSGQWRPRSACH